MKALFTLSTCVCTRHPSSLHHQIIEANAFRVAGSDSAATCAGALGLWWASNSSNAAAQPGTPIGLEAEGLSDRYHPGYRCRFNVIYDDEAAFVESEPSKAADGWSTACTVPEWTVGAPGDCEPLRVSLWRGKSPQRLIPFMGDDGDDTMMWGAVYDMCGVCGGPSRSCCTDAGVMTEAGCVCDGTLGTPASPCGSECAGLGDWDGVCCPIAGDVDDCMVCGGGVSTCDVSASTSSLTSCVFVGGSIQCTIAASNQHGFEPWGDASHASQFTAQATDFNGVLNPAPVVAFTSTGVFSIDYAVPVGTGGNVSISVSYKASQLSGESKVVFVPYVSCSQVGLAEPGAGDGVYTLTSDGTPSGAQLSVLCLQSLDGGGYGLVAKISGRDLGRTVPNIFAGQAPDSDGTTTLNEMPLDGLNSVLKNRFWSVGGLDVLFKEKRFDASNQLTAETYSVMRMSGAVSFDKIYDFPVVGCWDIGGQVEMLVENEGVGLTSLGSTSFRFAENAGGVGTWAGSFTSYGSLCGQSSDNYLDASLATTYPNLGGGSGNWDYGINVIFYSLPESNKSKHRCFFQCWTNSNDPNDAQGWSGREIYFRW